MARLYSNENVPYPTVVELRNLGHDVETSMDAGLANLRIPDDLPLKHASEHGRVVVTNDRFDFRRLHGQGFMHVGIVEFTNDADFTALAHRISSALASEEATGRFYASVTQGGFTFRT